MKVVITNMDSKPSHCADCPICDQYDQCMLMLRWYGTWEEQYRACPLMEEEGEK